MRALLLVISLAVAGRAQSPAAAMDDLVRDPDFAGARVGVVVLDLENHRVVCAHDADRGFMTASNMKLISSASALFTLGPAFRFRTTLWARGDDTAAGGVLHGDLELRGSGDPTFGGRRAAHPAAPLAEMVAEMVRDHGVREVLGAVFGNDDCQPDEIMGDGWSWGYQSAGYAAQVCGLCYAENCVRVVVTGGAPAAPPAVVLLPETRYISLTNTATTATAPAATPLEILRRRATNEVAVRGQIAPQVRHVETVSVENPTAFAACALREVLQRQGITVRGDAADLDDRGTPLGEPALQLASHDSPPLSEILMTLNKVSQNLYAEQLIRAASRAATGQSSMAAAADHAKEVLRGLGVDTTGMVIADGSGLTRLNLVQPSQLAALLAGIWASEHRDLFLSTLPIAGVDGTLSKRFDTGPAHGHVHAKTGYISRVVALSGYVPRPDAERPPLVFSILTNNFTCETDDAKRAVDRFVTALARHAGW